MHPSWERYATELVVRRHRKRGSREDASTVEEKAVVKFENKILKDRLYSAFAVQPVLSLVEFTLRERGDKVLSTKLNLHRGTIGRWLKGHNDPDPDKLLAITILVLETAIQDLPKEIFPSREKVIAEAVRSVLATIREQECGGERVKPSTLEIACAKALVDHEEADAFLPDAPQKASKTVWIRVIGDVLRRVESSYSVPGDAVRFVSNAIVEWAECCAVWCLFAQPEWEELDGVATE